MKYKAIIEMNSGEKIILELNCREYHANKLQYVFSRTLDRSIYKDCHVVAVDSIPATAAATCGRSKRVRKKVHINPLLIEGGKK